MLHDFAGIADRQYNPLKLVKHNSVVAAHGTVPVQAWRTCSI